MEAENMAVQDQEMGMMNIPLESTPAAQGNTTHVPTGSPAVSRSLPEFPPKGSDNRRCLECKHYCLHRFAFCLWFFGPLLQTAWFQTSMTHQPRCIMSLMILQMV